MATQRVSGHCLCGAVQYVVDGDRLWCGHCHCESCRRNTGSAVATFVGFERKDFSLVSGQLTSYESSPGVRRSFCSACGTPVAYESEKVAGEIHIFLGTLEKPQNYEPEFHVFCKYGLPWLKITDDIPHYDTLPEQGTA